MESATLAQRTAGYNPVSRLTASVRRSPFYTLKIRTLILLLHFQDHRKPFNRTNILPSNVRTHFLSQAGRSPNAPQMKFINIAILAAALIGAQATTVPRGVEAAAGKHDDHDGRSKNPSICLDELFPRKPHCPRGTHPEFIKFHKKKDWDGKDDGDKDDHDDDDKDHDRKGRWACCTKDWFFESVGPSRRD
ncbi:hypothetical protein C0991_008333 [Blastosporella zonata]|nr:hypothetical protein C0991_008333 [Blastosporella zonata]